MAQSIGIDFGTTASSVAIVFDGKPIVVGNSEGTRVTPSVVAFTKEGRVVVGAAAKRRAIASPENAISSIKRFLGRRFADVESERRFMSFRSQEGPDGSCRIRIRGQDYSPEELAAHILAQLKSDAERFAGNQINEAVITVPVAFNAAQRQALIDAAAIAGLHVSSLISEPTAAAVTYSLSLERDTTALFFDVGGGNVSVSILKTTNRRVEVLASVGDSHVGGDDFDFVIALWLADLFEGQEHHDLNKDPQALQRLIESAEKAKSELSFEYETAISLPFLTADSSGPKHLDATLTASGFRDLALSVLARISMLVEELLESSGIQSEQIDEVIMIGNCSRIPAMQQMIYQLTHKQPKVVGSSKEMVAIGAAIYAAHLAGDSSQPLRVLDSQASECLNPGGVCLERQDLAELIAKNKRSNESQPALTTRASVRSEADTLCYAADRQLKEANNSKEKQRARQALAQLKAGLKANVEAGRLNDYMEELRLALQLLVENRCCGRAALAPPLQGEGQAANAPPLQGKANHY